MRKSLGSREESRPQIWCWCGWHRRRRRGWRRYRRGRGVRQGGWASWGGRGAGRCLRRRRERRLSAQARRWRRSHGAGFQHRQRPMSSWLWPTWRIWSWMTSFSDSRERERRERESEGLGLGLGFWESRGAWCCPPGLVSALFMLFSVEGFFFFYFYFFNFLSGKI